MAIDLGEKRVGVALSDEGQSLATPYGILTRTSFELLLAQLADVVARQHVESVVIGYPRSLNGHVGPQARLVEDEAQRIQTHLRLPMTLWDERLTTVRSEQMLVERGGRYRHARKRPHVDAMVAAIILQEYLDARRAVVEDPFFE
ncbi:MAG: Holliday junction resolvase RuvX [Chloroflexi bacterium]|nr:Holliday junction resolvase RuvX [Chloroflexota bacterium]